MTSIIPEVSPHALQALATAALDQAVTFRAARMESGARYKIDAAGPVVYLNHEMNPAEIATCLGEVFARLHGLADDRRRSGLRAVAGPAPDETTTPVRPALRLVAGGA